MPFKTDNTRINVMVLLSFKHFFKKEITDYSNEEPSALQEKKNNDLATILHIEKQKTILQNK